MTNLAPVRPAPLEILIVDDREANLQSLAQLLARDDVRIHTALTGNEALGLMLERDFALVLLDVQMPGMDGFEVASLMRGHERTRHVPIIFVTAISKDREHIFSGYDAGAVDYLFKPLDPHVIRAKVAVFLELKRSQLARERLLESLARVNTKLEESARLKSEYLAAASHELRTPLTAMKEFCSLVRDEVVGPLNDEQRRCLDTALRNCRRLGGIIESLVDLDSVESGRFRLQRRRLDLGALLRERAAAIAARCRDEDKRLEISLPTSPGAGDALGDGELVASVLDRLLDNARKFSPRGGALRLRVRESAGRVTVEIGDQGPGIEPRHRLRILRKFIQIGRQDGPGCQGLGLGLTIAARLLELHDSRLDLLASPGHGSIFGFSLPAYSPAAHARAFCVDTSRLATARWEPWWLVVVADRGGGPLPGWLADAAEAPEAGADERRELLTVAGRPALAALVRDGGQGLAGWAAALLAAAPADDPCELAWAAVELDEDGAPRPLPDPGDWNDLSPLPALPVKGAAS